MIDVDGWTMEYRTNFLAPGSDGQLPPDARFWRKGVVYTRRSPLSPQQYVRSNYRVSAAFKCSAGASSSFAGFSKLYQRVRIIATRAISEKTCVETGEAPSSIVSCQGWRRFGEGGWLATAFIMLEVRCSPRGATEIQGEPEPTEEALLSPGGASIEELARLAPQSADELYNEFDFTEPSAAGTDPVTLSYGERVLSAEAVDFEPAVQRAERLAETYHAFLQSLGETRSDAFRIIGREWFLANQDFVTIHICFDR